MAGSLGIITGQVISASGVTLLARITGQDGEPITQEELDGITVSVRDRTTATTLQTGIDLLVPDIVFDTLQQGFPWTQDSEDAPGPDGLTGYNFMTELPAAWFAGLFDVDETTNLTTPHDVQVDLEFTPASGEKFRQPWRFRPEPTWPTESEASDFVTGSGTGTGGGSGGGGGGNNDMTGSSPTGRIPLLGWSPDWQGRWNNLVSANHAAWSQRILPYALATGTAKQTDGDKGQWATLAYQITGNVAYARAAWNAFVGPEASGLKKPVWAYNPDQVRQLFPDYAWMYDWLYPALSAAERTLFYTYLDAIVTWCFTKPGKQFSWYGKSYSGGGWNVNDTDQMQAQYLGCRMSALATVGENTFDIMGQTYPNPGAGQGANGVLTLGGDVASAADLTTVRNAIYRYWTVLTAGGELPESPAYNQNTGQIVLGGYWRLATAVPGALSEVQAALPSLAQMAAARLTADLACAAGGGDTDNDTELANIFTANLWRRLSWHSMILGLAGSTTQTAPLVQATATLLGSNQVTGLSNVDWRWAQVYDPAMLVPASGADTTVQSQYASGQGVLVVRDGTKGVWMQGQNAQGIQHSLNWLGDAKAYDGGWWLRHPIGYGGVANSPYAVNGVACCGLGNMQSYGPIGHYQDSQRSYLCMRTGGAYYGSTVTHPPANFLADDGLTRRVLYANASQTFVFDDWFDLLFDPRTASDFSKYLAADQALLTAATALTESMIHMPVRPTVGGASFQWQADTGDTIYGTILLPVAPVLTVFDENANWGGLSGTWTIPSRELFYHLRVGQNDLNGRTCIALRRGAAPLVSAQGGGVTVDGVAYTWNADGSLSF